MSQGSIEVVCGPMFAGKSTELLRRINRHTIAQHDVRLYRPIKDTRNPHVHTHDGAELPAREVLNLFEALVDGCEADVIAVDEVQFFTVDQCDLELLGDLAHEGKRVILAGVDTDHLAAPFVTVATLLGIATSVTKLTAVCADCGSLQATRTQWTSELEYNEQTRVGGADRYAPKCVGCFLPYRLPSVTVKLAVDFSGFTDGMTRGKARIQELAGVENRRGAQ